MVAVGGCGGDSGRFVFADAGENGLGMAITAAIAGGVPIARNALMQAEEDALAYACPATETSDGVTSYAGGCSVDEDAYEGTATSVNLDGQDFEAAVELEFVDFVTGRDSYHGTSVQSPITLEGQQTTADLEVKLFGITLGFRGGLDCLTECVPSDETVAWTAFGDFDVAGAFGPNGNSGWMELTGRDVFRIDFDAGENNCWPYTIDEEPAGEYCL